MKLLSITGNTKLEKTNKAAKGRYLFAGLSLMPNVKICPGSKAAGCMETCLQSAGRGIFKNVQAARRSKTAWFETDKDGFLDQLRKDLHALERKAKREGLQPVVRLNVLSDIAFEAYNIPQSFPNIQFYDYTKRAGRIGSKFVPDNYHLTFSYSANPAYQAQVQKAFEKNANIAVVFSGGLPSKFAGRKVIDGDLHDLRIDDAAGIIIGLRAKGKAKTQANDFVVPNPELITSC